MIEIRARTVGCPETLDVDIGAHLKLLMKAQFRWKIQLSPRDLPYLEKLRFEGVKGAHELIQMVDKYRDVEVWQELSD